MLGQKSTYSRECFEGGFFGADYNIKMNIEDKLDQEKRDFNREMIPIYLDVFPEKNKVQANVSCSFLYTISKDIKIGDVIISPNGKRQYFVGEVKGDYSYKEGKILPHRREVEWQSTLIDKSELSDNLRNSAGSIGSVCNLSVYSNEIEKHINRDKSLITSSD